MQQLRWQNSVEAPYQEHCPVRGSMSPRYLMAQRFPGRERRSRGGYEGTPFVAVC